MVRASTLKDLKTLLSLLTEDYDDYVVYLISGSKEAINIDEKNKIITVVLP